MWMHNGGLGGWKYIKRKLCDRLADKWYLQVKGGTDTEWAFALFLDTLERLGHDPSSAPETGFGPNVLRKAVELTISQINELTDSIPQDILQNEDVDTRSLLNFAVTDGHSVICTRYISSSTDEAASLYYSSGTQWVTRTSDPNDRQYQMERKDRGADIVLVTSEPLTFERGELSIASLVKHCFLFPTPSLLGWRTPTLARMCYFYHRKLTEPRFFCRKLGERTYKFYSHNPPSNRHDPADRRQVLRT